MPLMSRIWYNSSRYNSYDAVWAENWTHHLAKRQAAALVIPTIISYSKSHVPLMHLTFNILSYDAVWADENWTHHLAQRQKDALVIPTVISYSRSHVPLTHLAFQKFCMLLLCSLQLFHLSLHTLQLILILSLKSLVFHYEILGSGALFGKMFLVRIKDWIIIKLLHILRQVRSSKG